MQCETSDFCYSCCCSSVFLMISVSLSIVGVTCCEKVLSDSVVLLREFRSGNDAKIADVEKAFGDCTVNEGIHLLNC